MKFDWDENKNTKNIQLHGIDFNDVKQTFFGPMAVKHDDRYDYGEQRLIGLGLLEDIVIVVVFTESNNTIRIISARKANKNERKIFEKEIRNRLA